MEKCKEKNSNELNKMIIYNNSCVINVKKLKNFGNNEKEKMKLIDKILLYLNLIFNDINKRIEKKYKSYFDKNQI